MNVPVKAWLDKVPGGIIIVPLFLGCLINTFFPAALRIGSFTTGIVDGTSALVGIFFVCMGAQLDLKCAPQAMKTGFTITIVKFAVSVAIGLIAAKFFNDSLFGLSALAIIAAVSNSNGALFGALTKTYGSESDQGAGAIMVAIAEGYAFAAKAGIDLETTFQATRGGFAGGPVYENKVPKLIRRDYEPGARVAVHRKDILNAKHFAHHMDVDTPLTDVVLEVMDWMNDNGHINEDQIAMVKYYEDKMNVHVGSEQA